MRIFRVDDDERFVEYEERTFAGEFAERTLQAWLRQNSDAILEDSGILIIGEEVATDLGKSVDLLGVDREGDVVVIELKRGLTPRTVLAQALEYTAFAAELTAEDLEALYRKYTGEEGETLADAHRAHFELDEEETVAFNKDQRIVVVGDSMDPAVRASALYLRRRGIKVTCVEFDYFKTRSKEKLLSTTIVVGCEPVGRPAQISTTHLPIIGREEFLQSAGPARALFETVLALEQELGGQVNWGSKGFSLGAWVGPVRTRLCEAYTPVSANKANVLYTTFVSVREMVADGDALGQQLRDELLKAGPWKRAGRELKYVPGDQVPEADIVALTAGLRRIASAITAAGPRADRV